MTAAMSWQKINLPATQLAADQHVGWRPKRSVDLMLVRVAELCHLVQTAAADNPNRWKVIFHFRNLLELNPKDRQDEKWIMAKLARRCIIFARPCRNFLSRLTVAR